MSRQSTELAWDITDWETDAVIDESNLAYNLTETFLKNGLILPASIVCREDQEAALIKNFTGKRLRHDTDMTGIRTIGTRYGDFKLKVLPLARTEITYTRVVR